MLSLSTWRARFDRLADTAGVIDRLAPGAQIHPYLADQHLGWYHHPGDLVVPENVHHDIALVVDGDLVIHGFLDDYVAGILVVLGDLVVRDLVSWGAVYVAGNLYADGIVYGYYNDYTFEVAGEVHARALVLSDKSSDYRVGRVEAEIDSYYPTKEQFRAAREILVPEVYDDGARRAKKGKRPKLDRPDYMLVRQRLHARRPLFQAGAISA